MNKYNGDGLVCYGRRDELKRAAKDAENMADHFQKDFPQLAIDLRSAANSARNAAMAFELAAHKIQNI